MSGADYFDDGFAINAYMNSEIQVDVDGAKKDHANIAQALKEAGVQITKVDPPKGCQDGVYTANWGLCIDDTVVLSRLPNKRQAEEKPAREALEKLGKTIVEVPEKLRFSGQGDALPCGDFILAGSHYRSDIEVHPLLADTFGKKVISLQTVPLHDGKKEVTNKVTGWPDSFFYDIDLAIAVLDDQTIAWCPEAFLPESQDKIAKLKLTKIEVSIGEAMQGLACNLVSTGKHVIMSNQAPLLESQFELAGYKVIKPEVQELQKGGGFIRCTTLTI